MRIVATVLWAALLVALGWYAFTGKAPAIERDILARTTQAVSPLNAGIAVTPDGRTVALRGPADSEAQRLKIVEAATDVWGALVTDATWVAPVTAAEQAPADDGRVAQLEGQVDTLRSELEAAKARIAELSVDTAAPADEPTAEAEPEATPPFTVEATETPATPDIAAATPAQPSTPDEPAGPQQALGLCNDVSARLLRETRIDFETASATIPPQGIAVIDRLVEAAKPCIADETVRVTVGGHTDSQGQQAANLKLSQERAEAVKKALAARGVTADEITAIGFGASMPIADNATEAGRSTNRRITIEWSMR